ncbi:D-aminoacyl-tRNA deacylase [Acetobacterium bakii]|uniref:D-aminoacyl-tRNA deacylase n=1 Tax=Acetobacterium bakii TaxID=52689 RepID=A0A0L6U0Y8_9FIRM|nr:D-aminoacyl-tRNA deacylase [Acetobacterium bakii]KNZ42168.1 tyrosyl-tRNA deacylase [Acetobacterium bakii]
MRVVIQRVSSSAVRINHETVGAIGNGLNVLLGIKADDTEADMDYIINKLIHLRIFEDDDGKMNQSILDIDGEILLVSQFTLYGDCRKGRRPGFSRSGPVAEAEKKYDIFVKKLRLTPIRKIETGVFQAEMEVMIVNDGPVTLLLDSEKQF